jgi:hypothetical protein
VDYDFSKQKVASQVYLLAQIAGKKFLKKDPETPRFTPYFPIHCCYICPKTSQTVKVQDVSPLPP